MSVPERLSAALADRYRLERELGQGGMATVYLAEDLKHDREVVRNEVQSVPARSSRETATPPFPPASPAAPPTTR